MILSQDVVFFNSKNELFGKPSIPQDRSRRNRYYRNKLDLLDL